MRDRVFVIVALIACLALMTGCADDSSNADHRQQVEVAADFIEGLWTADAALIEGSTSAEIEDIDPAYLGVLGAMDTEKIERDWDGDVLTITYDGEQEPFVISAQEDSDPPVVTAEAAGASLVLGMASIDDEWIVSTVDDMGASEFVTLVTTVDPEQEELVCHTSQLIMELAFSTYERLNEETSTDPDDYVDLIEETRYCLDPESQYSLVNSDSGYFVGFDGDGHLEPCSVHGYHEEVLEPAD